MYFCAWNLVENFYQNVCTFYLPWAHSRVASLLVYFSFLPWELASPLLRNISPTPNQTPQTLFLHTFASNNNKEHPLFTLASVEPRRSHHGAFSLQYNVQVVQKIQHNSPFIHTGLHLWVTIVVITPPH